ncbi:MAG: GNAT family N-acetyltransferase [Sphingomonadales bacterium]|nr:GNAT family N-acetyltransferase [Sphingomonadales bacterium]
MPDLTIREARDNDAEGLIALIGRCFAEYAGCVLDLDAFDRPLLAIASSFAAEGGEVWVAEREGRIVGSGGYADKGGGLFELKRLYVDRSARRQGLASRLLELVETAVAGKGGTAIDLWSDTRFIEAHAFYERHGYRRLPEMRDLADPSNTTEYHFMKELAG